MTKRTEHTPTPWLVEGLYDGPRVYIIAADRTKPTISRCGHPERDARESAANTAFIVRACNAHEDLVHALTRCYVCLDVEEADVAEAELALAALAKAKGE